MCGVSKCKVSPAVETRNVGDKSGKEGHQKW